MPQREINALMLLRVIATLMIVTVHFGQSLPIPYVVLKPISYCQTAVCIFFILSGYYSYKSLEKNNDLMKYYIKRIKKIIPLYYFVILINIIAAHIIGTYPPDITKFGWLRFFLFLNGILPSQNFAYWNNGAALWTMSAFGVFYMLAPLFYRMMQSNKKLYLLLLLGGGVSWISKYVFMYASTLGGSFAESCEYLATHSVFYVLYEFILGMYIAFIISKNKNSVWVLLLLFYAFWGMIYIDSWWVNTSLYSVVVYGLANVKLSKLSSLSMKTITTLDKASYSIYLGHTTVMFIFSRTQELLNFSKFYLGIIDFIGCILFIKVIFSIENAFSFFFKDT